MCVVRGMVFKLILAFVVMTASVIAQGSAEEVVEEYYPIHPLVIEYFHENSKLPPIEALKKVKVVLSKTNSGCYINLSNAVAKQEITVGQMMDGTCIGRFRRDALISVCDAIISYFNNKGISGIRVVVKEYYQDSGECDLSHQKMPLKIKIYHTEVRGVSVTQRGINNGDAKFQKPNKFDYIHNNSPIKSDGNEVLATRKLEKYLYNLNRHPNRRVDTEVNPIGTPGSVDINYVVTESKPWTVYANVANTSPRGWNNWQEVMGYYTTQLTNQDDIFSITTGTDSFGVYKTINVSYARPISYSPYISCAVMSTHNRFVSAEYGYLPKEFEGKQWKIDGEIKATIFQQKELFCDIYSGGEWRNIYEKNYLLQTRKKESFLFPRCGVEVMRKRSNDHFMARLGGYATALPHTKKDMAEMGRLFGTPFFAVIEADVAYSFFIDTMFNKNTDNRINEISLKSKGQYGFKYRLIPQMKSSIGGSSSVRGYRAGVASGDSSITTSFEYLLHIPKMLLPSDKVIHLLGKKGLRLTPQYSGGMVDWNCIIKTFLDVGSAITNNYDNNFTYSRSDVNLMGVGLGVIMTIFHNINVSIDWAIPIIKRYNDGEVIDSQFLYFSSTIMF
jgi:hypothetical protein